MAPPRKQFCPQGHDTFAVGRYSGRSGGGCKVCVKARGQRPEIKAYRKDWGTLHPEKLAVYHANYVPTPEAAERRLVAGRLRDREPARRAAQKARLRQWQIDNAAYVSARSMEYVRKQERLAKTDADGVWDYYGSQCVYCGLPATGFDHLIPVSKGGRNIAENLAPCC